MDLGQTHAQIRVPGTQSPGVCGHEHSGSLQAAADSNSEAHSGPCYGGLGSASQPLSAPPQPPGSCADTLTSNFFLNHHALRCQWICIVRVV